MLMLSNTIDDGSNLIEKLLTSHSAATLDPTEPLLDTRIHIPTHTIYVDSWQLYASSKTWPASLGSFSFVTVYTSWSTQQQAQQQGRLSSQGDPVPTLICWSWCRHSHHFWGFRSASTLPCPKATPKSRQGNTFSVDRICLNGRWILRTAATEIDPDVELVTSCALVVHGHAALVLLTGIQGNCSCSDVLEDSLAVANIIRIEFHLRRGKNYRNKTELKSDAEHTGPQVISKLFQLILPFWCGRYPYRYPLRRPTWTPLIDEAAFAAEMKPPIEAMAALETSSRRDVEGTTKDGNTT